MHIHCFTVLILAASGQASTEPPPSTGVAVFGCDFGRENDRNFDRWPDGWTRVRGRGFPEYVKIAIQDERSSVNGNSLRIDLDGGAASVYSPPIEIHPEYGYIVRTRFTTRGLTHNVAFVSVDFLDESGAALETHKSPAQRVASWQRVALGPLHPPIQGTKNASIGLHLHPEGVGDLTGSAIFDEVKLMRIPRMSLRTSALQNICVLGDTLRIECSVSGLASSESEIHLELLDVEGSRVDGIVQRIPTQIVKSRPASHPKSAPSAEPSPLARIVSSHDGDKPILVGSVSWDAHISRCGHYRLRASVEGQLPDEVTVNEAVTSVNVVVVDDQPIPATSCFGWSLPRDIAELDANEMTTLLKRVGVKSVKYPVWLSYEEPRRTEKVLQLFERCSDSGIEVIGLLDEPPKDSRSEFSQEGPLLTSTIFAEPTLWKPALDPVVTQLALKVRRWQLGHDNDTSLAWHPRAVNRIARVKAYLRRFEPGATVAVGWDWHVDDKVSDDPPWDYRSRLIASRPTTEATKNDVSFRRQSGVKEWVSLVPLPRADHTVNERVNDLVKRMVLAKTQSVEQVFLSDPFNAEYGLFRADGTPDELLLPWRTTTMMLSGTSAKGSLALPHGSHNQLFERDGEAILVVWNESTTEESVMFLGKDVWQVDVWGRRNKPRQNGNRHVLQVGPRPLFVVGTGPTNSH